MAYKSKKEKIKIAVEKDLMQQLCSKGLEGEYYKNLVSDYMYLYKNKEKFQMDIDERGIIVEHVNAQGYITKKKNESCDMLLKTNQQMLKILEFLGIKPSENITIGNDEDVL